MPTTVRGYPFPAPADPANVPADLQALASAIDSDISATVPDPGVTSYGDLRVLWAAADSSVTLSGANYCYVAMIIPKVTVTPTKFCWWCTLQSGNYDVGIIDWDTRARLWSSGSTACPAPGAVVVPIAGGPTLTAGIKVGLVFAADNSTLELSCGSFVEAGMGITYDGDIASGERLASFPIPAMLGVWTESQTVPALALRA